jgi:hypothetical protein
MVVEKPSSGSTTIVGGRPMRRAVEVSDLPQGVERVLTLAALNHRFREDVLRDPVGAAQSKGIVLDGVEAALLRSARPEQLAVMADRMVIPRSTDRRTFVKAVSASVVAMVTGKAVMLCSGCTGMDTWRRDAATAQGMDSDSANAGAVQQWTDLGGYTCYLYLPREVTDNPSHGHAVMIALHGDNETCLASVQRWSTAAEKYGFGIVAVNWSDVAVTAAAKSQLARDLGGILQAYSQKWSTTGCSCTLSSRGGATPIAFQAGYLEPSNLVWSHVAFLGGVPDGDWVGDPGAAVAAMRSEVRGLYYLLGDADPEYTQGKACVTALRGRGLSVYSPTVSGSLSNAVLDFSEVYLSIVR